MGKSAKILSAFLIALIILSAGGFLASYRNGKRQTEQTTTSLTTGTAKQADATGEAETTAEADITTDVTAPSETSSEKDKNEEKETTKLILTTSTKATSKPESTSAGTTAKTGYPFNYAGINPVQTKITDDNWNLMLINADNFIPDSYNFKLAPAFEGAPAKLDARAAVYYTKMYNAAKKEGPTLSPTSANGGYRSLATQQRLFEDKIARYGKKTDAAAVKKAALINQPPGCSEHNAGLAMDIISTDTTFENTKAFKWLSQNAADYGFIMRYPASKSAITGVMYEPWHWRFVGVEHAKAIKASGLCLEEYLKTL